MCDAFAHLGFLTQHHGGGEHADGVADAILGPLAYRVALECKTAKSIVSQPDCAEVAREVAWLDAEYGVMVGPAFQDDAELLFELQAHNVTAFTVQDLRLLLELAVNPFELKTVLVPGYASDVLTDLLWNRRHGEAICHYRCGDSA